MNRLTDFLVGFSLALLLHGMLALGAVWFWTLRPPELRPMFQGGDVSLAVTFVAAADRPAPRRSGEQALDIGNRKPVTTAILTDPAKEMAEDGQQIADDGRQMMDEEGEDQDMLDAETAAPAGQQPPDSAAEPPPDTFRQGVSGAVRRKSEIRPYYPLGARLRGEEGAVTVRVWVNGSGRARRCEVVRSSGYSALDAAAVDAARRTRYVSTRPGAWRAKVETTLTFRFRLTE